MKKLVALAVIAILIAAFFIFDLGQYLSLEYIQSKLSDLQQFTSDNLILAIAIYMVIYIAVAALSLPGASLLTLLSGALFGLVVGTIAVSFASTIGATVAFLVSRYLLRDTIQNKFGEKLKTINEGIEKEGGFYLFTIRMIPLFPFFIVNLTMGLTTIKTWTFAFVSQLGMLAGTIVYVNLGKNLADIESLSGLLSLPLLFSFALLGIFPLIAKKVVSIIRDKKGYQHVEQ